VKAPGVATLLTTRFREAVPVGVRVQPLDVLPRDEALSLLRTHVGSTVDDDPAVEQVMDLCERLPLFLNVAGRAVANSYYSLADYAKELRGRGLVALAEDDETGRASVVFDLSWDHLSPQAREVFAALALAPGEDVGPNSVQAWLRAAGGKAGRLLTELANASLLTAAPIRPARYRYHDRVRDYARGKLPLPEDEVRRRLLRCWTDWDMVKAEFEAVGVAGLVEQYQRLRGWAFEGSADFAPWYHFISGQAPVLHLYPELFFQQAFNEPVESPVSRAAQERVGTADEPDRWLEWVNRPREWTPPACLMVLRGHTGKVWGVAVTSDGRAVSVSDDGTVRVWDLSAGACLRTLEGHTDWVMGVALTRDGRAVSASADKTVRVWDLSTGAWLRTSEGHAGGVTSVAATSDGRAVSVSFDQTVRVWDLSTGACTGSFAKGSEEARRAWATIDLSRPLTADIEAYGLIVRATADGDVLLRYPGTFSTADSSADGRYVIAGDGRGAVYILNMHTRSG
jgi:hypothetical protein